MTQVRHSTPHSQVGDFQDDLIETTPALLFKDKIKTDCVDIELSTDHDGSQSDGSIAKYQRSSEGD